VASPQIQKVIQIKLQKPKDGEEARVAVFRGLDAEIEDRFRAFADHNRN
jgi:hypothetical protein